MSKPKSNYICKECGYSSTQFLGKCPNCMSWDSFDQVISSKKGTTKKTTETFSFQINSNSQEKRISLGLSEVDRVFGGGVVVGSVNLIGGEPGIGKSTLMLEVACAYSKKGHKSLYISGEESPDQVTMRANRIGSVGELMEFAFEVDLETIFQLSDDNKPDVLFIDSIQILSLEEGIPGSPSVVREATRRIVEYSKSNNITTFIIGHVTKEGTIAGPKTLEHLVDAVSYLNGDKYSTLRILSGTKNRFGATNEVGLMEMTEKGLVKADHHKLISTNENPGVAVTAVSMGNRPLALEVQALLSPTYYPTPKHCCHRLQFEQNLDDQRQYSRKDVVCQLASWMLL
ncbi:MAG: ATPase domain-containing protein [Caldisericia bacterium]